MRGTMRHHLCYIIILTLSLTFWTHKAHAQLVNPPCTNSVCVNADMRAVAKNRDVQHDGYPSYYVQLHPGIPCKDNKPQKTGVTVYKQVQRGIFKFDDTVCTGQGCRPAGNPKGGGRECVK